MSISFSRIPVELFNLLRVQARSSRGVMWYNEMSTKERYIIYDHEHDGATEVFMKHCRLFSIALLSLLLLSGRWFLTCPCASSKDGGAPKNMSGSEVVATVNSSDAGKEVLIHGVIGGKKMIMKDATFWDEYWTLQNGPVLKDLDPSWEGGRLKKGLVVDIRGKLVLVPGHMGVEDMKQYPGYEAFSVKEIRICTSRSHRNTVFNLSQGSGGEGQLKKQIQKEGPAPLSLIEHRENRWYPCSFYLFPSGQRHPALPPA